MGDKLEVNLRITLDRPGLERFLGRKVEADTAFFILGMVHAQLSQKFTDSYCQVDLESATGLDTQFVRSMNSFARSYKRVVDDLNTWGQALVDDAEVLDAVSTLHQVEVTQEGNRWRVIRTDPDDECPDPEQHPVN